MDQCPRRFLVGAVDDAIKGLPGNAHALGRVLIVEPFAIGQPHGFQFVGCKGDLFDLAERNASRLKIVRRRAVLDSSGTGWPRHNGNSISHRSRF